MKCLSRSLMSSGFDRTDAYRIRGLIHLRLSKMRKRSTMWGFDIWIILLCRILNKTQT